MLDKATFEQYVPAFRSPTTEIYKKVEPLLRTIRDDWEQTLISSSASLSEEDETRLDAAIALRAAYRLIPQLDLVLTPTGFGIVSNQNTAPASPARVNALREGLRQEASIQEDLLIEHLAAMCALVCPHNHVTSLLWTPRLMRTYGVSLPDDQPIYREQLPAIQSTLHQATGTLIDIISHPLHEALLQSQYSSLQTDDPDFYLLLLNHSRRLLAALIQSRSPLDSSQPTVAPMVRQLIDTLERSAERIPQYLTSSTHIARNASRYENQQTDTSFFFG